MAATSTWRGSWSLERLFSPAPTGEARVWREALGATRAAWEAAYTRAEGPGAAALAILGDGRKPTEGVLPIGRSRTAYASSAANR